MGVQAYQVIVATVVGVPPVITFFISFFTARGANQRALRERLRTQLREINLACHIVFGREGWKQIDRSPKPSIQALEHIHQDGLLSPSRTHIERIATMLRFVHVGSSGVQIPALPVPEHLRQDEKYRRTIEAWESLDAESHQYLRALGKMDNAGPGGYLTYLRYRLIRARPHVD